MPGKKKTKKKEMHEISVANVNTEWFDAKIREAGLSRTDLDTFFGAFRGATGRVVTGGRKATPADVCTLARKLRTSVNVVLQKLGEDPPSMKCPVIGLLRMNGRVSILPPNAEESVDAPTDYASRLVALRVEADQTELAVYDGSVLFYEPATVVRADAVGRLSVIEVADDVSAIVGILDRGSIGRARVTIFGTREKYETPLIVSASPVKWMRIG